MGPICRGDEREADDRMLLDWMATRFECGLQRRFPAALPDPQCDRLESSLKFRGGGRLWCEATTDTIV